MVGKIIYDKDLYNQVNSILDFWHGRIK